MAPGKPPLRALSSLLAPLALLPACTEDAPPEGPPPGVNHAYFIKAETVAWDYAPSGIDEITGAPFDETANVFVASGPDRIGRVYDKALYREYTDGTFAERKAADPRLLHLGTLGPVIRASVGDTVDVTFRNATPLPRSIHVHGLEYDKASEGTPYADGTEAGAGDAVPPGGTFAYHYEVPERSGPGPADPSSVLWMYHSHVDEVADVNAGLMGAIIVTGRGRARADGMPTDVDREFVVLFEIMNENASQYLQDNIAKHAGDPASVNVDDPGFQESNLMHSMNGYVYGNLPGLAMNAGERVRWYLMDMGTETDLHTPHWHGQTAVVNGMRTDVVALLPAQMAIADMVPDDPGTWLFHCHVNDHIEAGMLALFTVNPVP